MEITNARYIRLGPYPGLAITFDDGRRAILSTDNKRTLLEKFGVVYLGPDFDDDHQVRIAADPEDGRPKAETLRGFTRDPEVVDLFRQFLQATDEGTFEPGEVV